MSARQSSGKLPILAVVLAASALFFSRASGADIESVATPVAVCALTLVLSVALYRLYMNRAAESREAVAAGLGRLAAETRLSYRPAADRHPQDYPSASGHYRGFFVKVSVDSNDESGLNMEVRVFVPELDDQWLHALSSERLPRVLIHARAVGDPATERALATNGFASRVASELAAVARQVSGVELSIGSLLVLVKDREASFWTEHTMETDPERLRVILDRAVDVAVRLRERA